MNKIYFKKNIVIKVLILTLILIGVLSISSNDVSAVPRNLTVKVLTPMDFNDIWLGTSTGGYDLIAEKNTTYAFKVFVKNGMTNRSLNNIYIEPSNLPFKVNSITPKTFEQLKPMEIKIYMVNITIPENATVGKYTLDFDIVSNEFPPGVFRLEHDLKVVTKINNGLYIFYVLITVAILIWFFFRKGKIWKEEKGKKKQQSE